MATESNKKSESIQVRLTPEEKKRLVEFSSFRGFNYSVVARKLLAEGMETYKSKPLYPYSNEQQ